MSASRTIVAAAHRCDWPARPHVSGADRGAQPLPSHGEPAITVQNVKVADGGNAIVGNVTQHASVIVSDNTPAQAARTAPKTARARRRRDSADAKRGAQA